MESAFHLKNKCVATHPPLHLHPLLPEADLTHVVLKRVAEQVVSAVWAKLRSNKGITMRRSASASDSRTSCSPHPLPGLLQVGSQHFPDLLLTRLWDAWNGSLFGWGSLLSVSRKTFMGQNQSRDTNVSILIPKSTKWAENKNNMDKKRFFFCLKYWTKYMEMLGRPQKRWRKTLKKY